MAQTYEKVNDKLRVTTTNESDFTELELLEEKQRLERELPRAEKEVERVQAEIDEVNAKLVVINK